MPWKPALSFFALAFSPKLAHDPHIGATSFTARAPFFLGGSCWLLAANC
jgi:hypothetical protein